MIALLLVLECLCPLGNLDLSTPLSSPSSNYDKNVTEWNNKTMTGNPFISVIFAMNLLSPKWSKLNVHVHLLPALSTSILLINTSSRYEPIPVPNTLPRPENEKHDQRPAYDSSLGFSLYFPTSILIAAISSNTTGSPLATLPAAAASKFPACHTSALTDSAENFPTRFLNH